LTESISIAEFKELNGAETFTACLEVKVIQMTSSKDGISKKGKKYKIQQITISDKSGEMNLNVFSHDIGRFELDKSYEICELGVDQWKNNNVPKIVPATTIKEVSAPSDDNLKEKQKEIEKTLNSLLSF